MKPASPTFRRADRLAGLFQPAIVDLFAGCGGWSIGTEQALTAAGHRDRYVDLMVNHWETAVGVHQINHPMTEHLHASVWEVDPNAVLLGRRIAYLHLSPDCTDFSKAKGGRPKRKHIRALADVGLVWAGKRRPDVITLENVEEFQQWGPLLDDGRPDPARRGDEFRRWKGELEALGYVVDHRELRACDYGAPTTRKRLFVIARCDGKPIIWPEKTHGPISTTGVRPDASGVQVPEVRDDLPRSVRHLSRTGALPSVREERTGRGKATATRSTLKPYRTAAECIDWSLPMLSIFATPAEAIAWAKAVNVGREKHERVGVPRRPLQPKTLDRIRRGMMKFVMGERRPFIVDVQNYGWNSTTTRDVEQPFPTVTGGPKGGGHAVADVVLSPFTYPNLGEREGQAPRCNPIDEPTGAVTSKGNGARLVAATLQTLNHGGAEHRAQSPAEPLQTVTGARDARACVAALLTKHYGGHETPGSSPAVPFDTITATDHHAITVAHLLKFRGESPGTAANEPVDTITAGSNTGRPAGAGHAMGVACAYLSQLYGTFQTNGGNLNQPIPTVTGTGNHAALVAAFLQCYYSEGSGKTGQPIDAPAPTVTGHDRIGLVTVVIDDQTYVVTDIAMRMLTPRELARAQGFPDDYVIDRTADGRRVSKADQVKLIGNAVPPAFARAIVKANVIDQGVLDEEPSLSVGGVA